MDAVFEFLKQFERYTKNVDLLIAIALIAVLGVMMIPLPPFMLDIALTMSLSLSLLVLLVAIYTDRALDFSIFPSLLLLTTLFRLALNVATTRLILTNGHAGSGAV